MTKTSMEATMIAELMAQEADTSPAPEQSCTDGGVCHHKCVDVCWRSRYCVPLGAYGDGMA